MVHITHYRYPYLSDIPVEVPRNMSTASHHYQKISQSGVRTCSCPLAPTCAEVYVHRSRAGWRVTRVQTPFWTEDRSSVLCQRLHPTKYHAQGGTTAKETPSWLIWLWLFSWFCLTFNIYLYLPKFLVLQSKSAICTLITVICQIRHIVLQAYSASSALYAWTQF